jgi:hypothetical protein
LRVLHDRRIPGTQANIDHIAITSTGIYVIDAKRHVGKRPTLSKAASSDPVSRG